MDSPDWVRMDLVDRLPVRIREWVAARGVILCTFAAGCTRAAVLLVGSLRIERVPARHHCPVEQYVKRWTAIAAGAVVQQHLLMDHAVGVAVRAAILTRDLQSV